MKLAWFLSFAAFSLPALAAKRITVEQLQQTLASARATHRSDNIVAKQLAGMELGARLSPVVLSRLLDSSPGTETSMALRIMADSSVFLEPPANEIPPKPTPDFATQKAIIGKAIHYVARTLPNLPNFLAIRRTERYDDGPQSHDAAEWATRQGFQLRGVSETPIAFRDGRETDDPALVNAALAKSKNAARGKYLKSKLPNVDATGDHGLASWGEFGPILSVVLVDAAKGNVSWARWEQSGGKPVAVFNFTVDRSVSHYVIESLDSAANEQSGSTSGSRGSRGVSPVQTKAADAALHRLAAGYHGSLTVDPDNGTILRIVIQADLRPGETLQRGDIMVEYGSVKIGENSYICPVHSVTASLLRIRYQPTPGGPIVEVPDQRLNDVTFINYRRFGSETTLITSNSFLPEKRRDEAAASPDSFVGSIDASSGVAASSTASIKTADTFVDPVPAPGPPSTPKEIVAVLPPAPAVAPAPKIATDVSDEEVLLRSVNDMPGMEESTDEAHANGGINQTSGKPATNGAFTLQATTRLVDLGLVALDKHGKPVTDLKAEEVEIYDNGRKQQLRGFHHTTPDASQPARVQRAAAAIDTFTNAAPVVTDVDDVPDTLILMLDESHLAFNDLNRARGEVIRFLDAARPNARIALYAFSEQGFRVIQDATQDHALVVKKLATWRPSIRAIAQGQEFDKRNNQQFDTVRNTDDLNSVNGNSIEVPDYIHSADPQLRQMGQNPLRASLEGMIAIAQHFAAIPGHKSLAWIAGDSVLADWQDRAVGLDKGPNVLDAALLHTREALTEAHIALYAVDATSIEVLGPDSSLENQNVMLNPTSPVNSIPGGGAPTRNNSPGRLQSQMQADLHGIQGPVRQLAESTGGRAINRGSDLKGTLDSIEQDSTSLYELTFNPDTPADGKFHTLQLKIPRRKDVKLRYRSGYLYTEASTSNRQRLQEAIWSPQDLTDITLTAEAVSAPDSASGKDAIKLRIAFPSLSFQRIDAGSFSPPEPKWTDQLYIFLAERDDAGQTAKVDGDTLRLALKQATYESGMPAGIPYQHDIDTKARLGSIRVIVVDGNSGKMGSVTLPTSVFNP